MRVQLSFFGNARIPYKDKRFTCKQASSISAPRQRRTVEEGRDRVGSKAEGISSDMPASVSRTTHSSTFILATTCVAVSVVPSSLIAGFRIAPRKERNSHIFRHAEQNDIGLVTQRGSIVRVIAGSAMNSNE